jgi:hypothetical protein
MQIRFSEKPVTYKKHITHTYKPVYVIVSSIYNNIYFLLDIRFSGGVYSALSES